MSIAWLLGVFLVAALALALPPRADAYVYWVNNNISNPNESTIGRANLDGSAVNQSFSADIDYPLSLAVDGSHLYWTGVGGVGRANLDGGGVDQSFINAGGSYQSVAADGSHVYWTDDVAGTVGRANADGSGADHDFITGADNPIQVAVDGSHVYWVNSDTATSTETIGRANLAGGEVNQGFIVLPPASVLCGVAVDGSHIYWSDDNGEQIGRANLAGGEVDESFIHANGPCELALDSSHIYWASQGTATIGRANLDGSGIDESFIPVAAGSTPFGVAVDALPSMPAPPPSSMSMLPSNAFSFGKLKLNKKKGTATLTVLVPGAGRLALSGKGVKGVQRSVARAGPVTLPIAPTGRAKGVLSKSGKVMLKAVITFTPTGRTPSTEDKTVRLVRKR